MQKPYTAPTINRPGIQKDNTCNICFSYLTATTILSAFSKTVTATNTLYIPVE